LGKRALGLHGVAFKENPRTLENKMDRANVRKSFVDEKVHTIETMGIWTQSFPVAK